MEKTFPGWDLKQIPTNLNKSQENLDYVIHEIMNYSALQLYENLQQLYLKRF